VGFYNPHKIPVNGQQDLTNIFKNFWKISPIALSRRRVSFHTLPEISAPPHWPCDRSLNSQNGEKNKLKIKRKIKIPRTVKKQTLLLYYHFLLPFSTLHIW